MAVNNNAAAVLLAVAALAGGREVVISRGQLVEIGGSFRIPEILAASGARLVEVGTTNRTRIGDYERAIGPDTAALMRVHPSNFRVVGFTEEPSLSELTELARSHGLPVIDDIGSGVLSRVPGPLGELTAGEPAAAESVAAGADVVCFSGDKLLGGPQAGVAVGAAAAIERMRAHPLARAVRIDKLSLAALEATLRLHRDPVGAAARDPGPGDARRRRARPARARTADPRRDRGGRAGGQHGADREGLGPGGRRLAAAAGAGGPGRRRGSGAAAPTALCEQLRRGDPAIVARVHEDAVLLDPRTLSDVEVEFVVRGVQAALRAAGMTDPAAHPRHGRPHRSRQDVARASAHRASTRTACRRSASAGSRSSSASRAWTFRRGAG